jgi:hypothetical protein
LIVTGWNTPGTADEAHRHAGIPALEQDRLAVLEVRRHRAERDLQLFHRLVVDQFIDVGLQRLAFQHAGGLAEQRQGPVGNLRFVHFHRHFLQLEAGVAGRVQRAHHAAGAGADHHVRVDALRFQRLDHADVRKAARSAAAKGEADLDFLRRQRFRPQPAAARQASPQRERFCSRRLRLRTRH